MYGKLEKQSLLVVLVHPKWLFIRHSSPKTEMLDLLCYVAVREHGAPRAPSGITQQEFVELCANSALHC